MIRCLKFTAIDKGALRGFAELVLDSGMMLHDCQLMESNGRRWVGLPTKPQVDSKSGTVRRDAAGKTLYAPAVSIADRARRDKFNAEAIAAVDAFRGGSGGDLK